MLSVNHYPVAVRNTVLIHLYIYNLFYVAPTSSPLIFCFVLRSPVSTVIYDPVE